MSTKVLNPFSSHLRGKHRTKAVPPEPHRFVADIDATFMQQILDIAKGKLKPDIHHHSKADDLGAGFEVAKGAGFCHLARLGRRPARFNQVSSDRPTRYFNLNIISFLRTKPGVKGALYVALIGRPCRSLSPKPGQLKTDIRINWRRATKAQAQSSPL